MMNSAQNIIITDPSLHNENHAKETSKITDQPTSSPVITQYMSILGRVYVGSVNAELKEAELATLFCQFGAIKNINLAYEGTAAVHKGYAFIEFDTPEAAILAIEKMDGVACAGRGFKMGRPSSFFSELPAAIPRPSACRIYIANIHEYINEEDMHSICSVFGAIKTLCLVADSSSKRHKGYCYVEYEEERSAKRAIMHLNNLQLAGFVLHVTKAVTGMPLPMSVSSLAKRPNYVSNDALAQASSSKTGHSEYPQRKHPLISLADSPVIVLKGIAYQHEIDEFFESEMKEELAKFGYMESMHIAVDDRSEHLNAIHVFAMFVNVSSAEKAILALNGRFYGGRQIEASKYPLIRYEIKDFYC